MAVLGVHLFVSNEIDGSLLHGFCVGDLSVWVLRRVAFDIDGSHNPFEIDGSPTPLKSTDLIKEGPSPNASCVNPKLDCIMIGGTVSLVYMCVEVSVRLSIHSLDQTGLSIHPSDRTGSDLHHFVCELALAIFTLCVNLHLVHWRSSLCLVPHKLCQVQFTSDGRRWWW